MMLIYVDCGDWICMDILMEDFGGESERGLDLGGVSRK